MNMNNYNRLKQMYDCIKNTNKSRFEFNPIYEDWSSFTVGFHEIAVPFGLSEEQAWICVYDSINNSEKFNYFLDKDLDSKISSIKLGLL